jgi:ATP-dependent Clp protease ATP-binding subunit ClpA
MSDAKTVIDNIAKKAVKIAVSHQHEFITIEHVLAALLELEQVKEFFSSDTSLDISKVQEAMNHFMDSNFIEKIPAIGTGRMEPMKSKEFDFLFVRTVSKLVFSQNQNLTDMIPLQILLNMYELEVEDSYALTALTNHGVTSDKIRKYISTKFGIRQGEGAHGESMGEAMPKTPEEAAEYIKKYTINLNQEAKEGRIDPLIGRVSEVEEIVKITARRTKNNSVLVGDPGVGKTAVVEGLARNIVDGNVPEILKNDTVYSLDVGALVAGTRFRGDFEERMKNVLAALKLLKNSILFIDEIHTIIGAGDAGKGNLDVANLLKPALAKGDLKCIGSTTLEEYRSNFEKDRALLRRFKKVQIDEPSVELTKQILRGLKTIYEVHHGIEYSNEALDAAVELTAKYIHNAMLPDKAIDIIDSAGAAQRILPEDVKLKVITLHEIEHEVAKVAKIPETEIAEDEKHKLVKLEENLKSSVFGQNDAIEIFVNSVYIARAGLRKPNKPAGAYLLVGPTGSGKTEVSVNLAETMGIPLVKFDMSEYMEAHSVSRLIGSPPGYVGFSDGGAGSGLLVNAIDQNPACVLLLDEVEKAHPDLLNIFLQVMDKGKMTSGSGKEVNFRNVILIMTSNAGAAALEKGSIGFNKLDNSNLNESAIKKIFTPEFRNRLDAIVPFNKLKPEVMENIVDKFIKELNKLSAEKNVSIVLDNASRKWLA